MKEVWTGITETETLKKSGRAVELVFPLRETKANQHSRPSQPPLTKEDSTGRETYAGFEAFTGNYVDLRAEQSPSQQTEKFSWCPTNTLSQEELDKGKKILEEIYAAMTPEERELRREEQKWRREREHQWKEFEEGKRDAPPGKMKIEVQGSYQFVDTPEEIARKRETIPPETMKRFREIVDKPTDKLTEDDWQVLADRSHLYTFFETLDESERTKWGYKQEEINKEQWNKFLAFGREIYKQRQREQREKAAWMHERDPRYDPMTGDLLQPGDLPLSPTSSYHLEGKTRARCFLPPDHPALERAPRVQTDGNEEEPESPSNERLIQRLLKARFVEVEPTLRDKAHFAHTQWYRSLSPSEKMAYLDEEMRKMREGSDEYLRAAGFKDETAGEMVAKVISALFALILALISPYVEEDKDQPAPQPA
jgi:hypothetical protein